MLGVSSSKNHLKTLYIGLFLKSTESCDNILHIDTCVSPSFFMISGLALRHM